MSIYSSICCLFFSSRRRHTRYWRDWSSDVCSSDLGMGLDAVSYCLIAEELGRADSSVRGIVSVNVGLVGKTIAKWGTEAQKDEWLPRLASGETLGCYALTEPGAGSDPSSIATRADRDADGWRLSGSKIFITLGSWAGLALVFAQVPAGVTCFLVPTDAGGFSA